MPTTVSGPAQDLTLYDRGRNAFTAAVALATTMYIGYATIEGPYRAVIVHRALFLLGMLLLLFLKVRPIGERNWQRAIDAALAVASAVALGYVVVEYDSILRAIGATGLSAAEIFIGSVIIVAVLEATRRASVPLLIVALACIAYTLFGDQLGGLLAHAGMSFRRFIYLSAFSSDGVFGLGLAVASTYLFMFMLFGSAMQRTGAGDALMRLANSMVGRYRGGPAKSSVLASSILGSIVGSAIGNVVTSGAITIPLMKKMGFKKDKAAAVEVVASEGAQLIPPVMGAAAFIMAEITGIPYSQIAIAAIVPAALYYLSVFIVVDLEAARDQLTGMPPDMTPKFWLALKKSLPYLVPLGLLVYLLLVTRLTVAFAGLITIVVTVLIGELRPSTRLGLSRFLGIFVKGSYGAAEVTALIAAIGLVQQAFTITGLGSRLSQELLPLAGETGLGLLAVAMMVTIILGLGMPTPIAYILAAVFVGPAMVDVGFSLLASHMFLFYFAVKSGSTPPVALVAVVAAGISGGNWWRTAWISFYYSLPGFIVAYAFMYLPELLLVGEPLQVALAVSSAALGTACVSVALIGNRARRITTVPRIALTTGGVLLITAVPMLNLVGLGIALAITILAFRSQRDTRNKDGVHLEVTLRPIDRETTPQDHSPREGRS